MHSPSNFIVLKALSWRAEPFLIEITVWSLVRVSQLSDTCTMHQATVYLEMRLLQTEVSRDKAMHCSALLKYFLPCFSTSHPPLRHSPHPHPHAPSFQLCLLWLHCELDQEIDLAL